MKSSLLMTMIFLMSFSAMAGNSIKTSRKKAVVNIEDDRYPALRAEAIVTSKIIKDLRSQCHKEEKRLSLAFPAPAIEVECYYRSGFIFTKDRYICIGSGAGKCRKPILGF